MKRTVQWKSFGAFSFIKLLPPTVFHSVINLGGLNRENHIRYFY